MIILSIVALCFHPIYCYAKSIEEILIHVENDLAKQLNLESVAVDLNINSLLASRTDLELNDMNFAGLKDGEALRPNEIVLKVCFGDTRKCQILKGTYDEAVRLPMLKNSAKKGYAIIDEEVVMLRVQKSKAAGNYAINKDQIVGMYAKRNIHAYRPIKIEDIVGKVMPKGSAVRLVYTSDKMVIATNGEMLESAALGDPVRVRNLISNAIVKGVVIAEGMVRVGS